MDKYMVVEHHQSSSSICLCVSMSAKSHLMSSLHQGTLLTKLRCKPFPDATPVCDCAVCSCYSSEGVFHYNQASPLFANLLATISLDLFLCKSAICLFISKNWIKIINCSALPVSVTQ
ncbi:hypothetical protein XENORESO_005491 [Xenotaenia resolanae]|uniref:Uncharacterized protein n=1 Tax=Xenotaenia resolanae TaxID=208358 RepID=A0ABV0W1U6_9TELE